MKVRDSEDESEVGMALSEPRLLARALAGGFFAALSIAAGVYAGMVLGSKQTRSGVPSYARNQSYLDLGETFPDYPIWDMASGDSSSIHELVSQAPCVLLFVSPTCEMCTLLRGYWAKKVEPNLRSDIQIACVYDVAEWTGNGASGESIRLVRARLFTTDRHLQKQTDGIDATPTLVALDSQGTIKLVVTGFDRNVGADVLNRIL